MPNVSRRHANNETKHTVSEPMDLGEAVDVLKKFDGTKFDETVEVAIRLGIDPRQTAQAVRGAFSLPHGTGKKLKVIAFCEGDDAAAAVEAGAIEAAGEELAKKVEGGWLDFDVAIAHPSMMRFVGKLGRSPATSAPRCASSSQARSSSGTTPARSFMRRSVGGASRRSSSSTTSTHSSST